MKKNRNNVDLSQMERLLTFLRGLSAEDVLKLEEGSAIVNFELKSKEILKNDSSSEKTNMNVDEVIAHLNSLNSRNSGLQYLDQIKISKKKLEEIVRRLDLPLTQKDNSDKLKEKIIESTIGYRLRSQAIQQNN